MESAAEAYTMASVSRSELVETKQGLLGDLITTLSRLRMCFPNNPNLEKACTYINNYYNHFFIELEREHDIYDLIMDYIASFEYVTDLDDLEILSDLSSIFDELEECFFNRLMFYYSFCDHINGIFEVGILTNMNYLFTNYKENLDEEKGAELRALVPTIK